MKPGRQSANVQIARGAPRKPVTPESSGMKIFKSKTIRRPYSLSTPGDPPKIKGGIAGETSAWVSPPGQSPTYYPSLGQGMRSKTLIPSQATPLSKTPAGTPGYKTIATRTVPVAPSVTKHVGKVRMRTPQVLRDTRAKAKMQAAAKAAFQENHDDSRLSWFKE